jgi:hypothetical protein
MKPLLLMDVDGPMNPFRAPWFAQRTPADGYEFHELTPEGDLTYRVALNPEHGRRLLELSSIYDLAWATTWGEEANRLIAPILGLPADLPVISLPQPSVLMSRRSWKAERIVDWVGARPFAWFDDEINWPTRLWLGSRNAVRPYLAHRVPAEVGLTEPDFECIGPSRRVCDHPDLPRTARAEIRVRRSEPFWRPVRPAHDSPPTTSRPVRVDS